MPAVTYLPGKTIAECAAFYTEKLGWGIVSIPRGSKIPGHKEWNKPGGYVTSPAEARKTWGRGQNMGVVLGPSKIATLDLDDLEYSRVALTAVGINLDLLLDDESAVRLIGNPDNHAKLVFCVPEGFELNTKKLSWPSNVKPGEKKGIFELRAGPVQDIIPPSMHPDTKQPYRWSKPFWENGGIPSLAAALEDLWAHWDKHLPKLEAVCPWAPKAVATVERKTTTTVTSGSFDDFAREHGLVTPPGGWIADGELQRCDAHGPDGEVGRNDGSYILHGDFPENGRVMNWHRHTTWQPWKATRVATEVAPGATSAGDSIEPIYTAGDLPTATAAAWRAVELKNTPPTLFRYGGAPVRLGTDDADRPIFEVLTSDKMRHVVARVAPWKTKRLDKKTGAMVERDVPPPIDVIRDILATPSDKMPIPPVSAIVEVPTFAADGKLCNRPGYNQENRTFYAPPAGLIIPEIPTVPTDEDVRRARELLMEPILEVPFTGDADFAHALALAVLPYVREIIGGTSPIHLFDAPIHGSGKTLVAKASLKPAFGEIMFVGQADDDEFRKRITALAISGRTVFFLDNVTRQVSSATIAMAVTSPTWTDRILGKSVEVSVPNRMIWVVTGNNVILSGELARRCVRARIDPNTDQPWLRNGFRIPNMEKWITVNRGRLVAAALTLVRAWINDGMVPWPGRPLGSFESWSRVVGGILDRAGVGGFLENLDQLYEDADVENNIWREFVIAWWTAHGDERVGTATLFPIAEKIDGLDLGKSDKERGQRTALGAKLRSKKNAVVADYKITPAGTANGASLWRLIPTKRSN